MSEHVRVGLAGYGAAGAFFHAPLISRTPGMVLDAIVTSNPERAAQARAAHPGVEVLESAEALWTRQLDLAVIATPNRTHVALTRAAMRAGCGVVVDKPFAPTAAEGRALAREAKQLGRVLTVFQNRRWDSDFLTLAALIQRGALGEVRRFESRFERWRPVPKGGWRERGEAEEAGGLLYDLGAHLIDQALQLFGPVRRVHAELDRRREGTDADDDDFVALEHESGVRSHLWMSAVAAQGGPRFRVLGSRGAFTVWGLDGQEAALRAGMRPGDPDWGAEARHAALGADDALEQVPLLRGAYDGFYPAVLRALRGEGPVPVTPESSIQTLDVIEQAQAVARR